MNSPGAVHDQVHIHRRLRVFGVAKVQQRPVARTMPTLTAATGLRSGFSVNLPSASIFRMASVRATKPPVIAAVRVPPSACNTSQSTQSVRGAEFGQIDGGAHGAADEALDFLGAAVDLAPGNVALFSLQGRVGEHRVLGRQPAAAHILFLKPARDRLLDGDTADDARLTALDQGRTGGVRGNLVVKFHRAKLAGQTTVGAGGREDGC